MKLFLSAGHSPQDPGAVVNGVKEFDLNQRVIAAHKKATLVPTGTLRSKIDWVNQRATPNDRAVEIHYNTSIHASRKGTEVYYADGDDKELAIAIDRAIANKTGLPVGGVKKITDEVAPCEASLGSVIHDSQTYVGSLGWCRQIKCPAVIVEVGYMTNYDDMRKINDALHPFTVMEAVEEAVYGVDIRTLQQKIVDLQLIVVKLLSEIIRIVKIT
jgi:N-acetylmuramoyl-L-alanine amidase